MWAGLRARRVVEKASTRACIWKTKCGVESIGPTVQQMVQQAGRPNAQTQATDEASDGQRVPGQRGVGLETEQSQLGAAWRRAASSEQRAGPRGKGNGLQLAGMQARCSAVQQCSTEQ